MKTLAALIAVAAALALAPPAQADVEQDYQFYSSLTNAGWEIWDPPGVKRDAFTACGMMASGTPWRIVVTEMMNAGYPSYDAFELIAAAVTVYCPDAGAAQGMPV